jgi:hypothetical protein
MYRVDAPPPLLAEPDARTGWPRSARWALGIVLAVTLGFVTAAVATMVVVFQQYPAKVSIPDSVLGMNRSEKLTAAFFPDEKLSADARKFINERSLIVQAYVSDDGERTAWLVAGAGLTIFPANDLSTGLRTIAGGFEASGEVTDVPTGEMGGAAACVNVKAAGEGHLGVACGWADHGTLGIVTFAGAKDRDEAARWMLDIREAVVTR